MKTIKIKFTSGKWGSSSELTLTDTAAKVGFNSKTGETVISVAGVPDELSPAAVLIKMDGLITWPIEQSGVYDYQWAEIAVVPAGYILSPDKSKAEAAMRAKQDLELEIEHVFRDRYESELLDGEHPTLLKSPTFARMDADDIKANELCLSIECRGVSGDDAWAAWTAWAKEIAEGFGLTVVFYEWKSKCYFINFKKA